MAVLGVVKGVEVMQSVVVVVMAVLMVDGSDGGPTYICTLFDGYLFSF